MDLDDNVKRLKVLNSILIIIIAVLLVVFSSEMLHGIATKCKISWLIDWHVSMIFVIRNELVVFIKHGGPMYARECANALPNFCENYKKTKTIKEPN